MTSKEFQALPELLTRAQVRDCGVPNDAIDSLRDAGQIGAVQLPGRRCKVKGAAKWKYRKADVGRICGYRAE